MDLITLQDYFPQKKGKAQKVLTEANEEFQKVLSEAKLVKGFPANIFVQKEFYNDKGVYAQKDFSLATNFKERYDKRRDDEYTVLIDFYFNLQDKKFNRQIPIYCVNKSNESYMNRLYSVEYSSSDTDHYYSENYREIKYLNDFEKVFSYYDKKPLKPELKVDFYKFLQNIKKEFPEGIQRIRAKG